MGHAIKLACVFILIGAWMMVFINYSIWFAIAGNVILGSTSTLILCCKSKIAATRFRI